MRILISGGAGFLGSHLTKKLLELDHEVLVVDNFYTGNRQNVSEFFANPKFELLRHDVTSPLFVEVDGIFNLASPASPVHYQMHPVQTIKTNLIGSINLLGLARRLQCKIFQASTSEVYGDPISSPQMEEYWGNVNPVGIRSCYDEGKRAAETLFFDYQRQYDVDIAVARIFNTYGPKMQLNDGRVISNFIVQALRNQPITIYGSGEQTRSFCYVNDLIEGFVKYFFHVDKLPGPINLGNPTEFSILELAEMVIAKTKSSSKIVFMPLPLDDPQQRRPDIQKATKFLGWKPKIELSEGLDLMIADFSSRILK
jgi:UDP-glucuronate decarboxylase